MTVTLPPAPAFGTPVETAPVPEVLAFLARRRSSSALTLIEPAPSREELDQLLRLAARTPDHGKLSPWRFIVLAGEAKSRFADQLGELAARRGDTKAVIKLGKLKTPPLGVAVVFNPKPGDIPAWEQQMSAGAVCTTLLHAAIAMGYGANWITDWYAYDTEATAALGLTPTERVAGFVFIGTNREPPLERERPDLSRLVTDWNG